MSALGLCFARKVRPLPEPTSALPGTPEKLAVIVGRQLRQEQLWHPADASLPARAARLGWIDSQGNPVVRGHEDETLASPVPRPKTSRFVGVDRMPNGQWRAQLASAGSQIYLGLFDTEEEAAQAWVEAHDSL